MLNRLWDPADVHWAESNIFTRKIILGERARHPEEVMTQQDESAHLQNSSSATATHSTPAPDLYMPKSHFTLTISDSVCVCYNKQDSCGYVPRIHVARAQLGSWEVEQAGHGRGPVGILVLVRQCRH